MWRGIKHENEWKRRIIIFSKEGTWGEFSSLKMSKLSCVNVTNKVWCRVRQRKRKLSKGQMMDYPVERIAIWSSSLSFVILTTLTADEYSIPNPYYYISLHLTKLSNKYIILIEMISITKITAHGLSCWNIRNVISFSAVFVDFIRYKQRGKGCARVQSKRKPRLTGS